MARPKYPGARDLRVGVPVADGAAILTVQKVGGAWRRLTTFGGGVGRWSVADGDRVLATAAMRSVSSGMRIEIAGRRLHLDMPGALRIRSAGTVGVFDDATGTHVVAGSRVTGGRDRNLVCEAWTFAVAGHAPVEFTYRLREPRMLGFSDGRGAPLIRIGHDPSFTARAGDSWVRVLFRMWGAAVQSADRYLVHVYDRSVDAPLLALIGVWMERTADGRYPSSASI
jgi:hypothetical protein